LIDPYKTLLDSQEKRRRFSKKKEKGERGENGE
jgi:hypothetical protein